MGLSMRLSFKLYFDPMNKKRFALLALLIVLIGAFLLVPILKNCSGPDTTSGFPASFNFDENLASRYGEHIPIAFTVNEDGIQQVELIYNDSIFQTWTAPKKGKQVFQLEADYYGVGTRGIVLRSTRADGTVEEDARMIRVLSDIPPSYKTAMVVTALPHDPTRYTQGLEFNDGQLYEGTGDPGSKGATVVGKTDLKSGAWLVKNGLDANFFGEGITILGDQLYQITWQSGKCFVYDKNTMVVEKDFTYTGEGWGLCNDGKYLIMSDGTEYIYFRDPQTFEIVRTIQVYDDVSSRPALNELEYVDGKLYANVYTTNLVLVIDPSSGKVLEVIDASALVATGKQGGEVLNGIAYDAASKKLYMTGKYWGKLLEVSITE
jgi:glutamine cyclotransferase